MSQLRQWLTEEAYEDVRLLIFSVVKKFYLRYGGDFNELLGEALYIFIRANHDFNVKYKTVKFSTYIQNRVWQGLLDANKKGWRHPTPYLEDLITDKIISVPCYSDHSIKFLIELHDSIGFDARVVVKTVLNPDTKLKRILRTTEGKRIERRAIRKYLTKHASWSEDRVDDAFWDLSLALRS